MKSHDFIAILGGGQRAVVCASLYGKLKLRPRLHFVPSRVKEEA